MNDLIKTEFFVLINKDSQEITNEGMKIAYEKFITDLDIISHENDYAESIRRLNFTRIELVSLQSLSQYEQGEKCT